jgi:hypothetical protein
MKIGDLIDDFQAGIKNVFIGLITGIIVVTILGSVLPAMLKPYSFPYDLATWIPIIVIALFELASIVPTVSGLEVESATYLLGTIFGAFILIGTGLLDSIDILLCIIIPIILLLHQIYHYFSEL